MAVTRIGEVDPLAAWQSLGAEADAVLVDVRTRAEWSFVGVPDLSPIGKQVVLTEWRQFPNMSVNAEFADKVLADLDGVPKKFLFICRSGARSMEAAQTMAARLAELGLVAECVNVAEGFEGDLDRSGHRGRVNGWKARGLSWRQS